MTYKDRWGQYAKGAGDTFPQGIGFISAFLEKNGFYVDVLEPDIENMGKEELSSFLLSGAYTVVGISAFTTNIVFAFQTAKLIKSILPNAKVVIGGSHPTVLPTETMEECEDIDFVITHEGEEPMLALLKALRDGSELAEVPNLYYRKNSKPIKSIAISTWVDLDELPLFPYHRFDMKKYIPAPSLRRVLPTFNYMAQRGCPFACTFCDTTTHGRKVRYRSVENVISDLKFLKSEYDVKGIIFEGSNFTVNAKYIRQLCNRMIEEKLNLKWYCMGRVNLPPDLLPLMKKAGLWAMSFGLESGSIETLVRMKKKIVPKQAHDTISNLQKLGVRTVGSLILGYPGETEKDIIETIEYTVELNLDVAVFFIPVPFPATQLYIDAAADGGVKEDLKWEDYVAWLDHSRPIYTNPNIGRERHIELYNYAFKRFYGRPKFIMKQICGIRSIQDIRRLAQGFKSVEGLIRKGFANRTLISSN